MSAIKMTKNNKKTISNSTMARKVSFNDHKQINEVETVENDERNAVWYTRQDLQEIRSKNNNNNNNNSKTSADTTTTITKDAELCDAIFHKFDAQRQKTFIAALLKQQMEHRQMGMNDPKGLFQLSKAFSKKSKQEALNVARAQEKEVKTYQEQKQQTISIIDDALELLGV